MNRFLKAGLLMQFVQIVLIGMFAVMYVLLSIQWTLQLIGLLVIVIFNITSFILIIAGLIFRDD